MHDILTYYVKRDVVTLQTLRNVLVTAIYFESKCLPSKVFTLRYFKISENFGQLKVNVLVSK